MKKCLLFLALLAATSFGYAQTSVETLKKDLAKSKTENQKLKDENNFLNEKLNLCNTLANDTVTQISSFSGMYNIQVASCKGDRVSQSVAIDLIITQSSLNQKFTIHYYESSATDGLGNQVSITDDYNNRNYGFYTVFTETPLRIKLIVKNVMPGTDMFSLIALKMATDNMDKNPVNFQLTEIRNLKITW